MKTYLYPIFCLSLSNLAVGQLPYSEDQFTVRVEKDIEYGVSPNFANIQDTLKLDLYKPVGDNNCRRPCLVLIHGGAWIAGSKEDALIVTFANEFAKKGWVVAAINYRLGMHKASNYTQYAVCNASVNQPCAYIADTAEVIRANYRGQQDAKDAIRFLKERHLIDSTDFTNVFVAGESAGGFIAMSTAFFDKDIEKPMSCETIDEAPIPDPELENCLPANYSLIRGNLGDIQGNHHLESHDASVQGVGSIYGGMMNFSVIDNTSDWPAVYIYHQGSDIIVNYNFGRLLGRIDTECYAPANLCQLYANYPNAYGGKGMKSYLEGLGTEGPTMVADIIENYEYMNDCFDNGHSVDQPQVRASNMANLFAQKVSENGNIPGPMCNAGIVEDAQLPFHVSPNPSGGIFVIESSVNDVVLIYNSLGKLIYQGNITIGKNKIDLSNMGRGVFMLRLQINSDGILRVIVN